MMTEMEQLQCRWFDQRAMGKKDPLLVKQADLNVTERRHLLQAANCCHCCFAVQHLTTNSVQIVSGHLIVDNFTLWLAGHKIVT